MNDSEPSLVLTIRQPWAWAIFHGGKDVENRTWPTRVRGRVWIHAASSMKKVEGLDAQVFVWGFAPETCLRMSTADLAMGAIIGHVEIIDCVQESDSEWFVGPYGFVLRDPVPVDPIKMRGRLKFWRMP